MRLFEIEENINYDEIKQTIMRDCKPYLEQIDNNPMRYPLYRGLKKDFVFQKYPVRQDRRPMTMDATDHAYMVKAFKDAGFKANRNNSIFCTNSPTMASDYGKLYQVFPIGDFDYTWSEEIWDLFQWLEDNPNVGRNDYPDLVKSYHNSQFFKEAIASGNEIMIACDYVYLLNQKAVRDVFS